MTIDNQTMIKRILKPLISLSLALPLLATATTYTTNIEGVVIKSVRCDPIPPPDVKGVVVNRNATAFHGFVELAVIDPDGDFLWRGGTKVEVGPNNGSALNIRLGAGTCSPPNRLAFSIR